MKKKFKLDTLKVESFVTDVSKQHEYTLKGGKPPISEKSLIPNRWSWTCCE